MENEKIIINPEEEKETKINEKVVKTNKKETKTNEKEADEKEALETSKKLNKNGKVRIKVPIDPLNPKDLMVPVVINGYQWLIKRGETVEVPEEVVKILEEAKYI